MDIIKPRRQMETEACIRHRLFGKTAVDCIAGETRLLTQVFLPPQAITAYAAGLFPARAPPPDRRSEPGNTRTQGSTSPTISCPGTSGSLGCTRSPSTMCKSVRHTPQTITRIKICPGPGWGREYPGRPTVGERR